MPGIHRLIEASAQVGPALRSRGWTLATALLSFLMTRRGGTLIFGIFVVLVASVAILRPAYGWDIIAYVAVTKEHQFKTAAELHGWVYGELSRVVGPAGWKDLTDFDDWRRNLYRNADHFVSQLGFYRPKAGYVWSIAALGGWLGPYQAGWVLSFAFGIGVLLVFFRVLVRLRLEASMLLLVPVLLASNVQWLIRLPTPDAAAAFFILLSAYLLAFRGALLAYAAMAMAVLFRPDALLMVIGLVLSRAVLGRLTWQDGAGVLLGAAGFAMTKLAGAHVGWWPHFYFTNVVYVADMTAFDVPFTLKTYGSAVLNGVIQAVYKESWFHVYALLLVVYGIARMLAPSPATAWDVLMLTVLLALGGRIVAFPFLSSRIMCPTVLVTALAVVATLQASWPLLSTRLKGWIGEQAAAPRP